MGRPQIVDGISNGSRHSVREAVITTYMVVISFVYYSLIFGEFSENTSLPLNNPHGLTMV